MYLARPFDSSLSTKSRTFFIILSGLFLACERPQILPETPEVSFKSLHIYDGYELESPKKFLILTIKIVDGDGDIGLPQDDTLPGFEEIGNKNLFITFYEKIDGEFQEVDLVVPYHYRTPYLEPEGQDKTLKADIEVTMTYDSAFFNYDTIKYDFYVYDRKLNKSNTAESPEIPADTIGIIQ